MYWRITQDFVTDNGERIGHGQGAKVEGAKLFIAKLFDDDGEHYYTVEFDAESFHNDLDEGGLYQALKFGEWDAGATDLRVSLHSLESLVKGNTLTLYRERIARPDGWCSIFS